MKYDNFVTLLLQSTSHCACVKAGTDTNFIAEHSNVHDHSKYGQNWAFHSKSNFCVYKFAFKTFVNLAKPTNLLH